MTEPTETENKETGTSLVDSILPPKTKKFLELLITKMEKNVREQLKEETNSLRMDITLLQIKVRELEQEIKKLTPLRPAAPLSTSLSNISAAMPVTAAIANKTNPKPKKNIIPRRVTSEGARSEDEASDDDTAAVKAKARHRNKRTNTIQNVIPPLFSPTTFIPVLEKIEDVPVTKEVVADSNSFKNGNTNVNDNNNEKTPEKENKKENEKEKVSHIPSQSQPTASAFPFEKNEINSTTRNTKVTSEALELQKKRITW